MVSAAAHLLSVPFFVWSLAVPVLAGSPEGPAATSQGGETPPAPQTPPAGATMPGRLRVYLDCSDCFPTYLREQITWVDFVRQPQDAELTLLASSQTTGSGGREVTLRFIGRGTREGFNHEHKALTLPGDTEDTRRKAVLREVQIGLLDYLAESGLPSDVSLTVRPLASNAGTTEPAGDPWRLWVFSLSAEGS